MYKLGKREREFREAMRGKYPAEAKWYGVMTHCGREAQVGDRILFDFSDRGVAEVLLPEIKANGRGRGGKRHPRELLFSSYVFLRCRLDDETYMTISDYDDVFQILGRAYRIPSVIDDAEITWLKGILQSDPRPRLISRLNIGAEAVVTEGMMEGMQGRVIEYNARYVKIEIHFSFLDSGTSVIVALPRSQVRFEETDSPRSSAGTWYERIQTLRGG